MRVVDHDQRLAWDSNHFGAARHRLQSDASAHRLGQRHAQSAHGGDHAQQIGHVVLADQAGRQRVTFRAFQHVKTQALRAVNDGAGPQPRRLFAGNRPEIEIFTGQRGAQFNTFGIVDVDDRRFQAGPGKQRGLGLPVVLHRGVVVEVILREIGEYRHVDVQRFQPPLLQPNRRRFDGAGAKAFVHKTPQLLLQQHRVGRGQAVGNHRARLANAQRANHAAAARQPVQRLRQPPGGGGFAVRAGHSHHL